MAQPSSVQVLGGPLAGSRLEFRGGDVHVGSAADCAVRLDAPGVQPHHARIVIDITGATIYRGDGVLGVNDDLVSGDCLLRSGDFIWIGEPGGESSMMLQFTLGDVDESAEEPGLEATAAESLVAAPVEEVVAEDLLVEEGLEPAATESTPEPEVVEFASEPEAVELAPEAEVVELAPEPEPVELAPEPEPVELAPEPEAVELAPEPEAVELAPEPEAVGLVEMVPESLEEPSLPDESVEPAVEAPAVQLEAGPPAELMDETLTVDEQSLEPAGAAPTEIESLTELAPADETPSSPSMEGPKVVPPAPWQTPAGAAPGPEPEPPAEYGSAWESPAAPAVPSESPAPVAPSEARPTPAPPPRPAPKPPARPATVAPAAKRPPSAPVGKPKPRPSDSHRTPPPARGGSNTPMIVGGVVALLVVAGIGYFLSRPGAAPVAPAPTPAPTVAVATTPLSTPEAIPETTETALAEPAPEVPAPVAAVAATPSAAAATAPRATPPPRATPTATRPAGPAPTVAPTAVAAAPAAPVSQAPRLLADARAAATAGDLPRASQLLDQVLRLEPGNGEATAQKAEVAARLASLNRKFSVGTTSVRGGKAAQGPAGFDLGGGGVVKTDFSAQIRCTTTPASVEPGMTYSVSCSIVNIGSKAFRLEGVSVSETLDGAKSDGAGTAPRGDIAPQANAAILERSGTWSAKSRWSLEIIAKTTKEESFRAVYTWR